MSCLSLNVIPQNVSTASKDTRMSVSAVMVCDAWYGDHEVFYVQEGPFMVQREYFMVKKK